MNLQIDLYEDVNEKEWNSVVYNSKHGSIFHTIDWVNLLEKEYGKKVLIGAWLNGNLVGVFPSILGNRDFFTTYTFTKHIRSFRLGCDHGAPISIVDDPKIITGLLFKFQEIAKKVADKATIVTPFDWNYESELEALGFKKRIASTFIVDLRKSREELWSNLERNVRRKVRNAIKRGLTVRFAKNRYEMEKYHELRLDTARRQGLDPDLRSKTFYYNVWDKLRRKRLVKILFVEFNGEIISGAVILLFKKMITGFCSVTHTKYRTYQPHSLLNWHIIEWGNNEGFEYFDLGGGLYNQNLYRFKKKWGGDLNSYYIFSKEFPSMKYKLSKSYYSIKYKLLAPYYAIRRVLYKVKKRLIKA
jgi:lipid II:glycine glycyltransferase (peptidoglycan interpeptide bridge formation enzyme)